MVDLHTHILPHLDDGAFDLETSVRMADLAARSGVFHMAATSHGNYYVVSCINYLQKQALNTSYRNQVATQEAKLADLKERNDAAYESALKSVDLETIRNIAINKLGMVYAGEEQVKTYDDKSSDYVRQYSDVPTE